LAENAMPPHCEVRGEIKKMIPDTISIKKEAAALRQAADMLSL